VLEDVPIGFGVLQVWAEDENGDFVTEMKTMNVMVYPEIRCRELATLDGHKRWVLEPPTEEVPPVTELTGEPRRVVEQITEEIPRQDGVFHIPGFIWKRVDGYFIIDMINGRPKRPSDRYVPAKIRGYNYGQNDPWFDVDAQKMEACDDPAICNYCGPNNEDPRDGLYSHLCHTTLPAHESEPIGEIELDPLSPAEAFIELEDTAEVLGFEERDDGLCKD